MPSPSPSSRQAALRGLTRLFVADLSTVWRKLNLSSPGKLADPLSQLLQAIADKYGVAAATLAADWYDESRTDAGVPGSFTASPADIPDATRFDALARWGVGPLFGGSPDEALALNLIAGGLQRIILNANRDTITGATAADPAKPRWARHASANACAFCALMASRGPVYRSQSSAGDGAKYHDDCHCAVIEVFPGQRYDEAPYVAKWREAYGNAPNGDLSKALASMREQLGTN